MYTQRVCCEKQTRMKLNTKNHSCRMPNAEKMNEHIKTIIHPKKQLGGSRLTSLEHNQMHKLKLIGLELMRLFRVTDRLMTGSLTRSKINC